MVADLTPLLALLLHEGGWDEVLMVALGLGIAYLVIVWSGRRSQDEDDEPDDDGAAEVERPEATPDQPPR